MAEPGYQDVVDQDDVPLVDIDGVSVVVPGGNFAAIAEGADALVAFGARDLLSGVIVTEGADVLAATSSLPIGASLDQVEGGDAVAAVGTLAITGNGLAYSEGPDVVVAHASMPIGATLTVVEDADALLADAYAILSGAAIIEGADVCAASASLKGLPPPSASITSVGEAAMPGIYDIRLWRGNNPPIQFRFKNADGSLYEFTTEQFRLTAFVRGDPVLQKNSAMDADFVLNSAAATLTWYPDIADTRQLPLGAIAKYEIERRIDMRQVTDMAGKLIVSGGDNLDTA